MIQMLEEYKTHINRLAERYEEKNMELAIKKLKAFKKRLKLSKKRVPKTGKGIGEKRDPKRVWDKLNIHFEIPSSYILQELKERGEDELPLNNLLNLYAVNRLSAIAKMLLYCKQNNIQPQSFKEGRTPQRIKGWHKMSKITAITYGPLMDFYEDSYLDNKGMCYPLPDELDYLLSLEPNNIAEEITRLKLMLDSQVDYTKLQIEIELERITTTNKHLLNSLMERVEETKILMSHNDVRVQEKYKEIIPAMKRKHENTAKKEKRLLKCIKSDSDEKIGDTESPSASSKTMQEEVVNASIV